MMAEQLTSVGVIWRDSQQKYCQLIEQPRGFLLKAIWFRCAFTERRPMGRVPNPTPPSQTSSHISQWVLSLWLCLSEDKYFLTFTCNLLHMNFFYILDVGAVKEIKSINKAILKQGLKIRNHAISYNDVILNTKILSSKCSIILLNSKIEDEKKKN